MNKERKIIMDDKILNSDIDRFFETNKEVMDEYFPNVILPPRRAWVNIPGNEFSIWFNYAAIFKDDEYVNPRKGLGKGSEYINIYHYDDQIIEQIVPHKSISDKYDNRKRIVFKKNGKRKAIKFVGVYEFCARIGNREFYKRISKTINTINYKIDQNSYIKTNDILTNSNENIALTFFSKKLDDETEKLSAYINEVESDSSKLGEEKNVLVRQRINQSYFRQCLLERDGKCIICGIKNHKLLVASHIKPWSKSNSKERTDPNNGLLLCSLHDKLFDNYLISFDENGHLVCSKEIKQDMNHLNLLSINKITFNGKSKRYMKYHYKKFLKDNF